MCRCRDIGIRLNAHVRADELDEAGFGQGEKLSDALRGRTVADAGDEAFEPAADLHVDADPVDMAFHDELFEQQPRLPEHGEQRLFGTALGAGQRIVEVGAEEVEHPLVQGVRLPGTSAIELSSLKRVEQLVQ